MDRSVALTLAVGGCLPAVACQFDAPADRESVDAGADALVVDARPGPFVLTFGGELDARFDVHGTPDGETAFDGSEAVLPATGRATCSS